MWDTELTGKRESLLITDPSLQPPLTSPRPSQERSILLGQSSISFEFKQVVTSRLELEIFCWKKEKGHITQDRFPALSVLSSCFCQSELKICRRESKGTVFSDT